MHRRGLPSHPNTSEIELFGMRVVKPVRMPWYRDNEWMEHYKRSQLTSSEPWFTVERCSTSYQLYPSLEVTCPCGEVIWEMSGALLPSRGSYEPIDMPSIESDEAPAMDTGNWNTDVNPSVDQIYEAMKRVRGQTLAPRIDSETTLMDEWKAGVHDMLAEVKRRRGEPRAT